MKTSKLRMVILVSSTFYLRLVLNSTAARQEELWSTLLKILQQKDAFNCVEFPSILKQIPDV